MGPMNNSKNKLKSIKKKKKTGLLICANCTLRLRLALAEKTSFFHYLAYFCHYSQVSLYFLLFFFFFEKRHCNFIHGAIEARITSDKSGGTSSIHTVYSLTCLACLAMLWLKCCTALEQN